jgi:acyl-[acyl-carrier-protein]-phospholipid O-acyltransferase/long-chain-fatty-acid--[acyl-carrier-protein] ligase
MHILQIICGGLKLDGKDAISIYTDRSALFQISDISKNTLGQSQLFNHGITGNHNVTLFDVELALNQAFELAAEDGVQIAITGVSDPQKGEALVLLSALPQHRRSSEEKEILTSIRNMLQDRQIPTLWAPKYLVPVEAIPVLPTGKLDLRACKLLAEEALGIQS